MATQRTKVYLEGIQIDLDKNVDIDFTYSISDISDFEKRTTTFSKTINIPGTAHNNFVLGNYFDFNINNDYSISLDNSGVNFNSLKKAFVKVTVDNVEVFAGVLRLLEITSINGVITYQCAMFGSLGGLFSTIGDKVLTDLNLSEYDQTYNLTNITNSWIRTDYIYALSNYGLFYNNIQTNIDVSNFRPAMFAKELFNRILSESGYTYNETFWDTNNLDKILIINNEQSFSVYINELASGLIQSEAMSNVYNTISFDDTLNNYLDIEIDGSGDYVVINKSSVPLTVIFSGSINWTRATASADVLTIKCNAGQFSAPITGTSGTFNFTFQTILNPNVGYPVQIKSNIYNFNIVGLGSFLNITNFNPLSKVPALYGKEFEGKTLVPYGIKQADFIKSIINLLNLYIVQDPNDEFNLTFLPYPDFYLDEYVDWTDKKDIAKGFSIKPSNSFLPKTLSFKYKTDNDYYSKLYNNKYSLSYGSKIFETENQFSKDDKATELIFSLVPSTVINTDMYLSAMFDINENGTYKAVATNPKLAFFGGMKDCTNYLIYDGSTILDATNITYPYSGHLYDYEVDSDGRLWDLCFEQPKEIYSSLTFYPTANLYNKFYNDFVLSQNNKDSKLITLYFLLNTIDIINLNFQNFIKLDNGLYYLNKIDGYNPLSNDLTKVELLRIV